MQLTRSREAFATLATGPAAANVAESSLVGLLARRLQETPDRPAVMLSTAAARVAVAGDPRHVTRWTWRELAAAAVAMAERLEAEGLSRGDRLAHVGSHAVDWIVVDLACQLAGIVHAGLHAESPRSQQQRWCERLHGRAVLLTGDVAPAPPFDGLPTLDWRQPGVARSPMPRDRGAGDLEQRVADRLAACDPDAPAVIMISSGTTGHGRGVVHSQRSLASNAVASAALFLEEPDDVRLAWLPLSHSLARTGDLGTALVRGACLAVVEERLRVLDAARESSPTVILGVPAFFERVAQGLAAGRIADLPAALGGRVRVCVSGGAPLRRRTIEAFAKAGLPLVEGYGLAEAGPVVTLASPRTCKAGTVGQPIRGVQLRLDPQGQLEIASPSLALGVIAADETAAGDTAVRPLTTDGWLATGDRGVLDEDGHLRILGRIVDTLVLAGGEKLPPADVEALLAEDPAVAQVCVVGHGLRRPVALIVPEPDVIRVAVRRLRLRVFSRRQALRHPRLLAWLSRRIAFRQQALPRSWRASHLLLLDRRFDPDAGEVTASMKLRRGTIAERFAEPLAALAVRPDAVLPAGMASIAEPMPAAARDPAATCLWKTDASGGFAAAAEAAATELPQAVSDVTQAAIERATAMSAAGSLLDEAGRYATAAEQALADTGLFGLLVPREHGGVGGTMLDLARVVTRLAEVSPTAAGMLSVHSTIGAVSSLVAFGSPAQQARHLPRLARGEPLSIFAATEPDAGCDLTRVETTLERRDGRLLLRGHKMFITGATHGRLVKLLARWSDDLRHPVVLLVQLPADDTPACRLERTPLHPLAHSHNQSIIFEGFEIDAADVFDPPRRPVRQPAAHHEQSARRPQPDGGQAEATSPDATQPDAMQIVWHGLNRGRITLAAQAAGTLRRMLREAIAYARGRETWGRPIASRELVQGRLARIAAASIACDAVATWAAHAIDSGGSGELEAIVAKVTASGLVRDAAIDAYGIHGGRGFLRGHPLGDALHDHFAVNTYEGESGLLELALFKGLARRHPLAALPRGTSPFTGLAAVAAWRLGQRTTAREDRLLLDATFRSLSSEARRGLAATARSIDRAIRRHGRALAERQLLAGSLAARARELLMVLAVAHHADRLLAPRGDVTSLALAECFCRLAIARARGRHPSPDDLARLAKAGGEVVSEAS